MKGVFEILVRFICYMRGFSTGFYFDCVIDYLKEFCFLNHHRVCLSVFDFKLACLEGKSFALSICLIF